MKAGYLDADVILRYLTGDPSGMANSATHLFQQAEKEVARNRELLILSEITLAEVVWVLQRFYRFEKTRIAETLLTFMELPGLCVLDKSRFQHALHLYRQYNIGFGDALLGALALAAGPALVYSFDPHFSRIPGVANQRPG